MRWTDDGIFLTGRPHGETSVIADIFTRNHGRTTGLVKGGRSRRIRPLLQTANGLNVEWRARLDEQLGVYTVELAKATAAGVFDNRLALSGITSLTSLLQILAERDPHPGLFDAAEVCLASAHKDDFPVQMVHFELRMLDELGFGLELSKCVVTGQNVDLVYVSPKSGQAVSKEVGEAYREKLLILPSFLSLECAPPALSSKDVVDGLTLTGFFLRTHVFGQQEKRWPRAREEFAAIVEKGITRPMGQFETFR